VGPLHQPPFIKTFTAGHRVITLFGLAGSFPAWPRGDQPFGGFIRLFLDRQRSGGIIFSRIAREFIMIVFASTSISARSATRAGH